MLARLEQIDGVTRAEVDYGGNYMRLTCAGPNAQREATGLLREMGYQPEVANADAAPSQWYDVARVQELSAVEADVIARRVVGKFGRIHPLGHDALALEAAIAAALRKHFEEHRDRTDLGPGAFRREAIQSVRSAALTVLDPAMAEAFGDALEADLNDDHSRGAGL